jgi:hypothetical protein
LKQAPTAESLRERTIYSKFHETGILDIPRDASYDAQFCLTREERNVPDAAPNKISIDTPLRPEITLIFANPASLLR